MTKKYYICIRSDDFVGKLFYRDGIIFKCNGNVYTMSQLASASLWEIDCISFLLLKPLTKERRMFHFFYGGTLAYLLTLKSKETFLLNNVKYTFKEIKAGAIECKNKDDPPSQFTIEDFLTCRPKSVDFNGNVNYLIVVNGVPSAKVKRDYYHEVYRSRMFEFELNSSSEKMSLPFSWLLSKAVNIDVSKKISIKAQPNFASRKILSQSECKYYFALKTYDHHTNEKRIKEGDVIQNKVSKNFCEFPNGDKIKHSSKLLSTIFPISFITAVILSSHERKDRKDAFLSHRMWHLSQMEPGVDINYKHSVECKKGIFVGFYFTEEFIGIQVLNNYVVDKVPFAAISIEDISNRLLIENGLLQFFLNENGYIAFDGFQIQNDCWSERLLEVVTCDRVFYINFSNLLNQDSNWDITKSTLTIPERLLLNVDESLVENYDRLKNKATAHFSNDSQLKYEKYDSKFFLKQSDFRHFYFVFKQFKADDINVDKSCILASQYAYYARNLFCLDFNLPLKNADSYTDTHCLPIVNELEARLLLAISNFDKRLEVFCNYFVLHKISTSVLPFQVRYSLVDSDQLYDGICKEFLQSSEGAVFLSVENVQNECLSQFSADAIDIPNTNDFRSPPINKSFLYHKMDGDVMEFDGFLPHSTIRTLRFKSTLEVSFYDLIAKGYTWNKYEIFPPPSDPLNTHAKTDQKTEQSNTVCTQDFVGTDCHIVIKQSKSASGEMFLPGHLLKVEGISCINFDTTYYSKKYVSEISKHCFPLASEFQLRLLLGIKDLQKRLQFFTHGYTLYRVCNLKRGNTALYSIEDGIEQYLSEFVRFIKEPDEEVIQIELQNKENNLQAVFNIDNIHFSCSETVYLNQFKDFRIKIIKGEQNAFGTISCDGFAKNICGYFLSIDYSHEYQKNVVYTLAEILSNDFEIAVNQQQLTITFKAFKQWTDTGAHLKCILVLQVPSHTSKCQRGSLLSTKTSFTSKIWQFFVPNSQPFDLPDGAVTLPLPHQWVLLLQTLDDIETRIELALNGRLLQYICQLKELDEITFKNENGIDDNAHFSQFVLEANSNKMYLQVYSKGKELNLSCDKIALPPSYSLDGIEFDKTCSLVNYTIHIKDNPHYAKVIFDGFMEEYAGRVIKDSIGHVYYLTTFSLEENAIDNNFQFLVVNVPLLANDSSNISGEYATAEYPLKNDDNSFNSKHEMIRDNSGRYSEVYARNSDPTEKVIRTQPSPVSKSMDADKTWHPGDLCIAKVPLQFDPRTCKNVFGVVKAIFYFGTIKMAGIELTGVFDDCETLNHSIFQGENRFSKDDKIQNVVFVSTDQISPQTTGYDFKYNVIHIGEICYAKIVLTHKNFDICPGELRCIFQHDTKIIFGIELKADHDSSLVLKNSIYKGVKRFQMHREGAKRVVFLKSTNVSKNPNSFKVEIPVSIDESRSLSQHPLSNKWKINDICKAKVPHRSNPKVFEEAFGWVKALFTHNDVEMVGVELFEELNHCNTQFYGNFKGVTKFQKDIGKRTAVFIPLSHITPIGSSTEINDDTALVHHSSPKKSKRHKPWKPEDLCNVKVARISKPKEYLEVSGTVKAIFYCDGVKMIGAELFDEIADCLSYNHSRFQFIERFVKKDNLKNVVFLQAEEVFPMTSTPDINSNTEQKELFSKTNLSFPVKDGDICNAKIQRISKPDECIEASGTVRAVFEAGFAQIVGIELFDELDDCDAIEFPVFMEEKRFYKTDRRKNVVFVRVENVSPITTATEIEDKNSSSNIKESSSVQHLHNVKDNFLKKSVKLEYSSDSAKANSTKKPEISKKKKKKKKVGQVNSSQPNASEQYIAKAGDICKANVASLTNPNILVTVHGVVRASFVHDGVNMAAIESFEEIPNCNASASAVYEGAERFGKSNNLQNVFFLPSRNLVFLGTMNNINQDLQQTDRTLKKSVSNHPNELSTVKKFQGSISCRVEHDVLHLVSIELLEDIEHNAISCSGLETLTKTYNQSKPVFSYEASDLLEDAALENAPSKGTVFPDFYHYEECHFGKFGIQGFNNSCYLDSLLFAMFSTSDELDALLLSDELDDVNCKQLKTTLKENIVEPLRKTRFVSADSAFEFRKSIENSCPGISADQLLNFLFHSFLRQPLITVYDLNKKSSAFITSYQIASYKSDELLPRLSMLLTHSFVKNNLRFLSVGDTKTLILKMPQTPPYEEILGVIPDPYIDLSRISDSCHKMCSVCGEPSFYECKQCYLDEVDDVYEDVNVTYCEECCEMLHTRRTNHELRKIPSEASEGSIIMELYCVLCFENNRYVCFNKTNSFGNNYQWIFFNSMSKKVDEESEYYEPQVSQCNGISHLLKEISALAGAERVERFNEIKRCSEQEADKDSNFKYRILKDSFICFYRLRRDNIFVCS